MEQEQAFTSELTTAGEIEQSLATTTHNGYLTARGLEGVPASMLGIPRMKLVQPVSTGVELENGKDATPGTFYFSDSMTTKDSVRAAIITAKKQTVMFADEQGNARPTDQVGIIFQDLDSGKNYLTNLSVSSFGAFGKLMGLVASQGWQSAWEKEVFFNSEKRERQQGGGKYWAVTFQVGEPLDEFKDSELTDLWDTYGNYFEREGE